MKRHTFRIGQTNKQYGYYINIKKRNTTQTGQQSVLEKTEAEDDRIAVPGNYPACTWLHFIMQKSTLCQLALVEIESLNSPYSLGRFTTENMCIQTNIQDFVKLLY